MTAFGLPQWRITGVALAIGRAADRNKGMWSPNDEPQSAGAGWYEVREGKYNVDGLMVEIKLASQARQFLRAMAFGGTNDVACR